MMKVKILENKNTALLERDINEFLKTMGTNRSTKIELRDIKMSALSMLYGNESFVAMIIYNEITIC